MKKFDFNEFIAYDTETTGFSAKNNRVIQIGAIRCRLVDGKIKAEEKFEVYLKQTEPLPEKIVELTGITDELLIDKPTEDEAFEEIKAFFGDLPVVGYNIDFDNRFMSAMYERHGAMWDRSCRDVFTMVREQIPKGTTENQKLGTIADYLNCTQGLTAHNAFSDIIMTIRILSCLLPEYLKDEPKARIPYYGDNFDIVSVNFWVGFAGHSRQYINTTVGTFFYDFTNDDWVGKDIDVISVDKEALKTKSLKFVGAESVESFKNFRAGEKNDR